MHCVSFDANTPQRGKHSATCGSPNLSTTFRMCAASHNDSVTWHILYYSIHILFLFFYFFGQILLVGLYVLYASHGRSFWRPRRVGEHDQRHSNRLFDVARFVDITMWVVALRSISSNINIPFSCIVECVYMVYTHFNLVMCASHSARLHACHGLSLSPPFTPPSKKEFMAYSWTN